MSRGDMGGGPFPPSPATGPADGAGEGRGGGIGTAARFSAGTAAGAAGMVGVWSLGFAALPTLAVGGLVCAAVVLALPRRPEAGDPGVPPPPSERVVAALAAARGHVARIRESGSHARSLARPRAIEDGALAQRVADLADDVLREVARAPEKHGAAGAFFANLPLVAEVAAEMDRLRSLPERDASARDALDRAREALGAAERGFAEQFDALVRSDVRALGANAAALAATLATDYVSAARASERRAARGDTPSSPNPENRP